MDQPLAKAAALAAAESDLEDLFETAPCGYLSTDKDGRITRVNRTFEAWTGFAADTLVGKRFSDLLPIGGKIFYETHFVPMLRIQGSFNEVALEIVDVGGRRIPVLVNAVERRDSEGRPLFIRFIVFIAAERRSYERALVEARDAAQAAVEAERATAELREQFIAILGHDLRNPLASIAGRARLLRNEALTDRGRRVLGLIDGSVVRAIGLIDNVLDFARARLGGGIALTLSPGKPLEPVLRQVVAELQSIAPDRVVETSFALEAPVDCDHVRMGQLLSNLLGNALTHGARDLPVRAEASTSTGALVISVTNGGAAIPPATLEQLFQPFYRGQDRSVHEGLGLGLHIASEIARAHGGRLVAESDTEKTRFTFTMPLAPPCDDRA